MSSCGHDTTPRVRGKQQSDVGTPDKGRYNPACAGKTQSYEPVSPRASIQPRVCGENSPFRAGSGKREDTTPRVRGKLNGSVDFRDSCRYNPACAGKTHVFYSFDKLIAIQPRVCGENGTNHCWIRSSPDTTPRVRGKRTTYHQVYHAARYNPACAGKTMFPRFPMLITSIQPRVCGENSWFRKAWIVDDDTTPRVRGKHIMGFFSKIKKRYNPACAGKTDYAGQP